MAPHPSGRGLSLWRRAARDLAVREGAPDARPPVRAGVQDHAHPLRHRRRGRQTARSARRTGDVEGGHGSRLPGSAAGRGRAPGCTRRGTVRLDDPSCCTCPRQESNLRPTVPETGALSTELRRRTDRQYHSSGVVSDPPASVTGAARIVLGDPVPLDRGDVPPAAGRGESREIPVDPCRLRADRKLVRRGAEHDDRGLRVESRQRVPRGGHGLAVAGHALRPVVDGALDDDEIRIESRVQCRDAVAEGGAVDAGLEVAAAPDAVHDGRAVQEVGEHVRVAERGVGGGRAVGPGIAEHEDGRLVGEHERCGGDHRDGLVSGGGTDGEG
ncbi:unnamed protein product [Penicillium discolor]